jgi:hypothetical protein
MGQLQYQLTNQLIIRKYLVEEESGLTLSVNNSQPIRRETEISLIHLRDIQEMRNGEVLAWWGSLQTKELDDQNHEPEVEGRGGLNDGVREGNDVDAREKGARRERVRTCLQIA